MKKIEKLDLAISDLESLIASQLHQNEDTFNFFREESDELQGKLAKESGFREAEDEALTKQLKTFESEAKFRITKCKNVRLRKLNTYNVDKERQRE